jgi:ABC-type multidrug transport system ATPase subunit
MIKIKNVEKHYPNVTLRYGNIDIYEGGTIILGQNGSGKSTLLKAIAGLIEVTGQIIVEGSVSYMPERTSFPKEVSARQFLTTLDVFDFKLVRELNLAKQLDKDLYALSKGMRGKVNLIQCLAKKATWYLLDEPSSGLDEESLTQLALYLSRKSFNWIMSTHHRSRFQDLADKVIVLD